MLLSSYISVKADALDASPSPGPRQHHLDLGCGHGIATRALAPHFTNATGTDPSQGMLRAAAASTPSAQHENITWETGTSTSFPSHIKPSSIDFISAAQAAHWFPYPATWDALAHIVRPGGTVAFWGYADPVFPQSEGASNVLHRWAYGSGKDRQRLGGYWTHPGRRIVEGLLGEIAQDLPLDTWEDVKWLRWEPRSKYEWAGDVPVVDGDVVGKGQDDVEAVRMQKRMSVQAVKSFVRTWSAFHAWSEAHQSDRGRHEGGQGDVVDWMFDEIADAEPTWRDPKHEIRVDWPVGVVLARRLKT